MGLPKRRTLVEATHNSAPAITCAFHNNVCIAVRPTRDCRATRVHHTDTKSVALEAATKQQDRVGRLPTLAKENVVVVTEGWGITVQEVGCKFDIDGSYSNIARVAFQEWYDVPHAMNMIRMQCRMIEGYAVRDLCSSRLTHPCMVSTTDSSCSKKISFCMKWSSLPFMISAMLLLREGKSPSSLVWGLVRNKSHALRACAVTRFKVGTCHTGTSDPTLG